MTGFGQGAGALQARWKEIVGETLARRTEPVKLIKGRGGAGGALELRVDGPVAALIQHQAPQIMQRLDLILAASTGFVYTVSTMGITGERAELDAAARGLVARMRARGGGGLRTCVGIGISTADQVAGVLEYADGAIVGTALVRALRDGGLEGLAETARTLSAGTRRPA